MDRRTWASFDALGCAIAVTADHGTNPKTRLDASPDVLYLQDVLDGRLGNAHARALILYITDPYVVHHMARSAPTPRSICPPRSRCPRW